MRNEALSPLPPRKMDPALKAKFWNNGVLVGNLHLSDVTVKAALDEPNIGEVYELKHDPKRLQSSVTIFGTAVEKVPGHQDIVTKSNKE
ncbi:Hypothetical protein PHPALM_3908 [Phytophthora palmivora]|uniref:Uncharacterized protein n=1 Tax=Phytophthora palmivora TaxID=4796 RepID=A0A2P4YL64_9STRA|nr:Hypothetical protein PHPALM_3908 [Phytophthora palmivora]